jgi:NTE family protein
VRLITDALRSLFGEMNDDILEMLMPMLEWVEVAGGDVVVRQGGTDLDMYFVITGRLRAYGGDGQQRRRPRPTPSEGPQRRVLGEIVRGETVGEASFITGAPRNATVLALRDSLLARISRPNLEKLVMAYPQLTLSMARLVIARQKKAGASRRGRRRPANLCLLPVTPGVDVAALGEKLAARLRAYGEVGLLTSASIETRLGVPGIANAGKNDASAYRRLTTALDELESRHAALLLVPDASLDTEWSQRCLRIADRILLLADAAASPEPGADEVRHLGETRQSAAEQVLVLLHGDAKRSPQRTAEWLDRRAAFGISGHLHIRPSLERDMARLARAQAGSAIGLVLSGGGARCFAHLGVYKALQENGCRSTASAAPAWAR